MLKQLWIVLVMILVSVSSYSQYPIIKKIKQDSVVIMTIEQGKEINALYLGYNKTIDSLQIKTRYYDSAINQISKKQDTINLYRYHIENIKPATGIDQEFKEAFEKEKGINRLWTLMLFMALVLIKTQ
jgi:hypothetical protein